MLMTLRLSLLFGGEDGDTTDPVEVDEDED